MMELLQSKIEKEFKCRRCNACCRQPGFVYLHPGEAENIAAFLDIDLYHFTSEFCELQDRRKLVLKKKNGEECIFLDENGCRIHAAKPGQCREFPVKWRTAASLDYCAGIQAIKH